MDKQIGAQFYTIREHTRTLEDFEVSCQKIAKIGYKNVQISGTPLAAKDMRPVLDHYGLRCVTSHKGYSDFTDRLDDVIEYNRTLGCDLCGLGSMPLDHCKSDEGVTAFLKSMESLCQRLKQEGLYFGYHNHAFEFVRLPGGIPFDRLVNETDPEVFHFIVDTYWIQVGGRTPQDVIKALGRRAMAVHLKDYTVLVDGWDQKAKMTHIGDGSLDWTAILAACEQAGSRWAIVEQDDNHFNNDPFESLALSYQYLTAKGFC